MPLKQVIKDEQGNFVRFANISSISSSGSNEDIDLTEVNNRIDEVEEVANNAFPKSGGNVYGKVNFPINVHPIDKPLVTHHSSFINLYGSNDDYLASFSYQAASSNNFRELSMGVPENYEHDGNKYWSILKVGWDTNNKPYTTCSNPRDNYDTDIVNTAYFKDNAVLKLNNNNIEVHVGGEGESDTADLYAGRGFSIDKPFATLKAARLFLAQNYVDISKNIDIILHKDIIIDSYLWWVTPLMYTQTIKSDDIKRKITFNNYLHLVSGSLCLKNLILHGNNPSRLFSVNSVNNYSVLHLQDNLEFTGSVVNEVIESDNGGKISIEANLTGNITGKRYSINNGSYLYSNGRGENAIPGTIAGIKDSFSFCV